MLSQFTNTMAQVVASEPNWMTIGIILGIMVLILIVLLILPNGVDKKAIESDDKARKALTDKTAKKALTDGEAIDKDKMSLAEIKEAKRASVSEDKSKEERRELRKERRAATQTANAIHEREETESQSGEKKSEEVKSEETKSEHAAEEKKADAVQSAETVSENVKKDADDNADKKADSKSSAKDILSVDEAIRSSEVDTSDVFASLFGNGDSDLSFDDVVDVPKPANGMPLPTLGSALIPLSEFTRDDDDVLSELTKKLDNSSEKKTL